MAAGTLKPLSRRAWILVAVLAVCVVGRGGYALYLVHSDQIVTTTGDAPSYLAPARMLAEHARFENLHGNEEYLRTPGYPLFIAAVYRVFGERNTAVLLVQVLLSACTVYLAYLLASRMWSSTVGLVAAVLTLVEPLQNATSATLLTETLAAFLLLAVAAIGYHALTAGRLRPGVWALLGFAITVSTFVRPVTYYLPPFVLLLLLVWSRRRRFPLVDVGKAVAAFLVPIVALCGAWQVRNHHEVGSWRFSGVEAKNMYVFRAAGVVAREDGISLADAQDRLVEALGPVGTRRAGERYDQLYRAGVRIVREHPVAALQDAAHGLGSELFEVRVKVFDYLDFSPPEWLARAALAVLLAFYALCLYGIFLVARARRHLAAHALVLGIAAYNLLASAGPEAWGGRGERFRAPVMPILVLYAAFGACTLYTSLRNRRARLTSESASVAQLDRASHF